MIHLKKMSDETFAKFKTDSQASYSAHLAAVETVPIEEALRNAAEQFGKLVPQGLNTAGQTFFDVIETASGENIGFLWLGLQQKFGRKVASINDIQISPAKRGKGFGKALMKLVEEESLRAGASRVRLHVFNHNEAAKRLYLSMGFQATSWEMRKDL